MNILDLEIKIWQKFMENKYYRIIHNNINNLYHYDEIIRKNYHPLLAAHLNENEKIKKSNEKIRRPFWNVIVPVVYLIWPDIVNVHPFFLMVPSMTPANIRIYCSTMSSIWAANYIVLVFYGLSTKLSDFQFLHILNLDKSNGRGLDYENLRRTRLFRDRSYQFSAFIFSIQFYLILKQKSLQRRMHRFYNRIMCVNRMPMPDRQYVFARMNQTFVELQKEIIFNNLQLARFLSILFAGCSIALTYLTCVLFLATMPILFVILYIIIYIAHLMSLSTFIYYGSQIENLNKDFLRYNRKCLSLTNERQFVNNRYLYKHETFTSTMLEHPIGMRLMNGSVITSRTQVE
ncbi:hypothetical protein BLA29_003045, partial [Euroglyphus maynei]